MRSQAFAQHVQRGSRGHTGGRSIGETKALAYSFFTPSSPQNTGMRSVSQTFLGTEVLADFSLEYVNGLLCPSGPFSRCHRLRPFNLVDVTDGDALHLQAALQCQHR